MYYILASSIYVLAGSENGGSSWTIYDLPGYLVKGAVCPISHIMPEHMDMKVNAEAIIPMMQFGNIASGLVMRSATP